MSMIDRLKLHRLAGGNIISYAPLYAPIGDFIFLISQNVIHVYSTTTGLHVRELDGSNSNLIGMEIDLYNNDILVACTKYGELLYFKWSTGQIKRKVQLNIFKNAEITTFNQLDWYGDSETANVFILYKLSSEQTRWGCYETSKGNFIKVPCGLALNNHPAISAVNTKTFKIICIAQQERIYFIDYKEWKWIGLTNGLKIPITCLKWHPSEEMIATGDMKGRIFLWREFWDKLTSKTPLYHWHATPVTSVAFTQSGSSFYSSGMEAVVVVWNVDRPELRTFIPHITSVVRHIAISKKNVLVAVSMFDNSVQIFGNDHEVKCSVQEFTYTEDNGSGMCRFPLGLRLNPRSNTLVLNGRVGHLQFYSPHTRSLLYNLDVVGQNQLTMEMEHILYNTNVIKAAFNLDWMATGEVFNDNEHFPELRLKFWKYLEESQSYSLNTVIELAHQGSFRAIEFSSPYQVDNLLCATVGDDNIIKVWSLEETDNIYKKGKVWFCIAETNYKNLPIEDISFSQDGSLLAAGCANTLCIFKADSLKLKAALNAGPGIDGCISKAEIRLAIKNDNQNHRNETNDIVQKFASALENTDESLIKKLKQNNSPDKLKNFKSRQKVLPNELTNKQKRSLFRHIMDTQNLNFFQQLLLFQRLQIQCKVTPMWHDKMLSYLKETIYKDGLTERIDDLNVRIRRMNIRHRFKAKYRLQKIIKHNPNAASSDKLVSILSILGLKDNSVVVGKKCNKTKDKMDVDMEEPRDCEKTKETSIKSDNIEPLRNLANIKHVQFASNEHGHLVIVCTETRVLIWNLLTLRLENKLNLSAKHLAFDPLTNLAAVFDKNNELHIFQPKTPIPIYQRAELPNVLGATWLPRRYPKRSSIHIDWQSQSRLYFLTDNQEIMYFHDSNSDDMVDLPAVTLKNPIETVGLRYSTFGTYATQQITEKQNNFKQNSGPLIVGSAGRTAVKMLVDMSTHTMPPISLVCNDFLKSLVKPIGSATSNIVDGNSTLRMNKNGGINGDLNGDHEMSEDESDEDHLWNVDGSTRMTNGIRKAKTKDIAAKMSAEASRKSIVAKSEELKSLREKTKTKEQNEKLSIEAKLNKIVTLNLDLEL